MVSWARRRKSKETRKISEKQYEKHRRHNMLYAEPGVNDFVIVLDHLKPGFNIGKIYRSAEAFGAKAVHLIGTQYFDTKAAKGSFKWVPTEFHDTFESCYVKLVDDEYELHVLDYHVRILSATYGEPVFITSVQCLATIMVDAGSHPA